MVTITLAIILSLFSTVVMSYISMATPIGPWIAPTVVLVSMLLLRLIRVKEQTRPLSLIVAAGSVGGIVATAAGFSFPTLFFLAPSLFNAWMASPLYFAGVLSALACVAGLFGIVAADILQDRLIMQEQLPFPMGQLVYSMISVSQQIKKAYELLAGFVLALGFSVLQDGFFNIPSMIPSGITLLRPLKGAFFSFPLIRFDIWPMLWAIGFITGHVIAVPLAVGAVTKILLVDPLNQFWFYHLSPIEFGLAFCSGMVLYGALVSFWSLPAMLVAGARLMHQKGIMAWHGKPKQFRSPLLVQGVGSFLLGALFLAYFQFSLSAILFVYAATFACVYQLATIAGKVGLAPLGRFATFVMIPAMLLFSLNEVQIVITATFVEMAGGVAADILFGRKMAQLADLEHRVVRWYQFLGLIVASFVIGAIFWLLINHLELGSAQLCAYKAQSRQLLIQARQFHYGVLVLGACFSLLLSYLKVNAILVLGGLLMPLNISLGLIFGGLLTGFVKNRQDWEPFWSGVFASNSLWMLIRSAVR